MLILSFYEFFSAENSLCSKWAIAELVLCMKPTFLIALEGLRLIQRWKVLFELNTNLKNTSLSNR